MSRQDIPTITQYTLAMRQKGWLIALVAIILLCVAACILTMPLQPGCPYYRIWFSNMCEFTRRFSIDSLQVDASFLPVEVEINPIEPIGRHGTVERILNVIYLPNGEHIGKHEIERWAWAERAEESYKEAGSDYGWPAPPCGIPHNLDYLSPVADQFCAACSVGNHCKAVGQYQDYVSIFELDISSAGLTQSDFIAILVRIDERFAQYLELES